MAIIRTSSIRFRNFSCLFLTFFCGLLAGSFLQSKFFFSGSGIDPKTETSSRPENTVDSHVPLVRLEKAVVRRNPLTENKVRKKNGLEKLPAGVVEASSDLFLRKQWGSPKEDLIHKPKGLIAIAAGIKQKQNVDSMLKKFPEEDFTRIIFHYDNKVTEWEDLEWSSRAIHVAALHQTKWWFAKRFLHPSVVRGYEYIFIWDEDLGLDNFHGTRYMELVKRHKLEISQPAIDVPMTAVTWPITLRRPNHTEEVHHLTNESRPWTKVCNGTDPTPPCGGFVEIMAPVFSWRAWHCVWHIIQNDLVHGWGIDFRLGACVNGLASEKIGVVDAEWVEHKGMLTLGDGLATTLGDDYRTKVRLRCTEEFKIFRERWELSFMQETLFLDK